MGRVVWAFGGEDGNVGRLRRDGGCEMQDAVVMAGGRW